MNNRYVVYFSARKKDLYFGIGIAESVNPLNPFGPYVDHGSPIIEGFPGVIDIHWFQDPQ